MKIRIEFDILYSGIVPTDVAREHAVAEAMARLARQWDRSGFPAGGNVEAIQDGDGNPIGTIKYGRARKT